MPWFPIVSAVELARQQTRAAGQADPVAQYLTALNEGDTRLLETAGRARWWSMTLARARSAATGGCGGSSADNLSWLAGLHARTETVASHRGRRSGRGGTAGPHGPRRAEAGVAGGGRRRIAR